MKPLPAGSSFSTLQMLKKQKMTIDERKDVDEKLESDNSEDFSNKYCDVIQLPKPEKPVPDNRTPST